MPCEVRLHPATPAQLDRLDVGAIVLPMFAVRAQPRHVSGVVDWRMNGWLATLLRERRFQGEAHEAVLTTTAGWLRTRRLFLFGLGRPAALKEPHVAHRLRQAVEALRDAAAFEVAVGPPTAPGFLCESESDMDVDFAERWFEAMAPDSQRFARLMLLDGAGRLAEHREQLARAARARGLQWKSPTH
ncbi:MAG: M17 family peptidase N-terminal domain-containing protein [Myxococcota bacterium]